MKKIKKLIKKYFENFAYFYAFLGSRIFVSVGLSLLVGVLDGFGLAMFLPLLQMIDGASNMELQSDQMGNLSFLVDGLQNLGIDLNLQTVLTVILIFFTLKGLMKFIEGYYRVVLQQKFIKKVRFSNIDLLSEFKYSAFVTSDSGKIQNTFSGEVEKVLQAYRSYFQAFQYGIMVFVYISLAFLSNAQFAVLVALGGGLTNLVFKRIYRTTKQLSKALTKEAHGFQGLLIQNVANFKYLKATGLIYKFGIKLKQSIQHIEQSQRHLGILASGLTAMREPIIILVVVAVILIQVNFLAQSLGLIILSLLFFYRSLTYLMSMQNYWNTFLSVSGSLDNMTDFTNELARNQEKNGRESFEELEHSIELLNVCFSYGQSSAILKNISLKIFKKETIALVGESGSGKTTLLNILTGLLSATSGKVLIDGKEASKINLKQYQNKIGYITQEPVIFNDTVFNNVTFWDTPSPENLARFNKVLKMASIHEFVEALPEKGNAPLGNNGIMVSGGQKQRISIARELYKDVEFLFMDEATSALDSETEKIIQENIDMLKGKYTIVIIAHRLSTIRNADKIISLSDGQIQSVGTFEELRSTSASFKRMIQIQEL